MPDRADRVMAGRPPADGTCAILMLEYQLSDVEQCLTYWNIGVNFASERHRHTWFTRHELSQPRSATGHKLRLLPS